MWSCGVQEDASILRAYLSNVCVATAARRQGVAAALMTAAEDLARSLGEQGYYAQGTWGFVQAHRHLSGILYVLRAGSCCACCKGATIVPASFALSALFRHGILCSVLREPGRVRTCVSGYEHMCDNLCDPAENETARTQQLLLPVCRRPQVSSICTSTLLLTTPQHTICT